MARGTATSLEVESIMSEMKKSLHGAMTALVTPMNKDGSIDFGSLDALVDWQLEQGIDGLVPCGTTGESATMTASERAEVITRVVKRAGDKVTVIAGAGSNDTAVAADHQKRAADTGAAYALVVTPYYNKPTAEGLYRHYNVLLDAANIPIILYNVPGRTACDMLPETVERLAKLEGVAGIKEATGDIDRVAALKSRVPDDFAILSGDDLSACAFTWMGGDGVISVSSNIVPKAMSEMIRFARDGNIAQSREIHLKLRPVFEALFWESNPIPVKAAVAMQDYMKGKMEAHYRLPLCPMDADISRRLEELLRQDGWLKS